MVWLSSLLSSQTNFPSMSRFWKLLFVEAISLKTETDRFHSDIGTPECWAGMEYYWCVGFIYGGAYMATYHANVWKTILSCSHKTIFFYKTHISIFF